MTGDADIFKKFYLVLYGYGLPTVCAFGFLGNVLNLVILAGKRIQRSLRKTERSSNIGLISLAVADMCFCLTAFPSTFLPQSMEFKTKGFLLYYGCFCAAIINIFIMTSTWITVTMATERYLAICHPLKSRKVISLQRTKAVIISVYAFSGLFNIPVFWRYTIVECYTNNTKTYNVMPQIVNETFDHAYRAAWAIIGNFVPLAMLLFANIGLMKQIHKSYALRKQMKCNAGMQSRIHHEQEASNRITTTLVAIVVMFFILVAPSELLKHIAYLAGGPTLNKNYTYLTIEIITNVMQTMNFSSNFIIYCIINPSFRRTMKELICFQYHKLSDHDTYYCDGFNSSVQMGSYKSSSRRSTYYTPRGSKMISPNLSARRLTFPAAASCSQHNQDHHLHHPQFKNSITSN